MGGKWEGINKSCSEKEGKGKENMGKQNKKIQFLSFQKSRGVLENSLRTKSCASTLFKCFKLNMTLSVF